MYRWNDLMTRSANLICSRHFHRYIAFGALKRFNSTLHIGPPASTSTHSLSASWGKNIYIDQRQACPSIDLSQSNPELSANPA